MSKNKYRNLVLSVFGGILLWGAWPVSPFTFIIFVAWLPLFVVAESTESWKKFLGYAFIQLFIWNLLTTWWVAKSTMPGGISAFLANTLIMCIPWLLYYFTRKLLPVFYAGIAFVTYWISYEYLHHNWDLSWPWLTLGNVFATKPDWVQWYQYTGAAGGSLWVLLANIAIFNGFLLYKQEHRSRKYFLSIIAFILILFLPIVVSFLSLKHLTVAHNKYNVVVVQPNIDPYDEKFVAGSQEAQLQKLIHLSQQTIDDKTAVVIWPETAIPFQTNEEELKTDLRLAPLWGFLKANPHINLLTGLEGYRVFSSKASRFAKSIPESNEYYESYNSAALLDSNAIQIYHKSKLVPGVEVLPSFLNFMAPVFEKFGGTTGGYARSNNAELLETYNHTFNIAPAICYESIYSDYLTHFTRQGADLIAVITNDGWWGNTAGYKQHMNYARLRAIENRRWVARSANTGISCFIDPYGNVVQQLPWDKEGALKQDIAAFVTKTFYMQHGDYLSRIFSLLAAGFVLVSIFKVIKK